MTKRVILQPLKLRDFAHGCILLARDFNNPLEPSIDTSQGSSSISHKHVTYICKRLHDNQLMDIWRVMHPLAKGLHALLTPHLYWPSPLSLTSPFWYWDLTNIRPCPISLKLKIPSLPLKATSWKLNNVLSEDVDKKQSADELSLYFKDNSSPDISPDVLRKAHISAYTNSFPMLAQRGK